jgi:hypothetical protein
VRGGSETRDTVFSDDIVNNATPGQSSGPGSGRLRDAEILHTRLLGDRHPAARAFDRGSGAVHLAPFAEQEARSWVRNDELTKYANRLLADGTQGSTGR